MPEDITGLEACKARFDNMTYVLQQKTLARSVKAGAEIIRIDAQRRAPVLDITRARLGPKRVRWAGLLARSEMIKVDTISSAAGAIARIGPSRDVWYAHFVEFGTRSHFQGAAAVAMGLPGRGKGGSGGVPAQPFLRPAFDEKKEAAMQAIARVINEDIQAQDVA